MRRKIGLLVAGTALAMFAMGRVESLTAHRGFSGSTAFAQLWTEPADDSAEAPSVPDISGSYSGSVDDHRGGPGDFSADISQSGDIVKGTWSASFGDSGTLKGVVTSKGKVIGRLKISHGHGCGLNVEAQFSDGDEISGKYQAIGCGRSDHGTFEITD